MVAYPILHTGVVKNGNKMAAKSQLSTQWTFEPKMVENGCQFPVFHPLDIGATFLRYPPSSRGLKRPPLTGNLATDKELDLNWASVVAGCPGGGQPRNMGHLAVKSRLATSVCRLRHDRMEQGPTFIEFRWCRGRVLLSGL